MQFVKLTFALLAVGGASYALLAVNEAPFWLKFVSVTIAIASLIVALPDLPKAIDGITAAWEKIPSLPKYEQPPPPPRREQAVYARPGHNANCGIDPNNEHLCCEPPAKVVIEYNGTISPYAGVGGIDYWPVCRN